MLYFIHDITNKYGLSIFCGAGMILKQFHRKSLQIQGGGMQEQSPAYGNTAFETGVSTRLIRFTNSFSLHMVLNNV